MNYVTPNDFYRLISVEKDNTISESLKRMIHSAKYNLTRVQDLKSAYTAIKEKNFDILLIDFSIINSSEIEIINEIKKFEEDIYIILFINSNELSFPLKKLKELPVQAYLEKNDKLEQLPLFIEGAATSISQVRIIRKMNDELLIEKSKLEKAYIDSIETLKTSVEAKDEYTKGHSDRVAKYSVLIGKKLGLDDSKLKLLELGGIFHDIGKIGISDSILTKNGPLTDEEYKEIKKHPIIGKNILCNAELFQDIIPIVLYHHERYDGKGYPYGLSGENIPYLARIVSIADSFDAMTSKRSYRDKLDIEFVKNELEKNIGTQFDPAIAKCFINMLNNNEIIL